MRAFVTVADLGSFTKAGEVLYVAQSSLSTQIKGLEKELGVPLFQRGYHSLALTEAGRLFLDYSRTTLRGYEELCDRLRGAGANRSVDIGAFYGKRLKGWCAKLAEANSEGEAFNIRILYGREKEELLLSGKLDVALCLRSQRLDQSDLGFSPLYVDHICFAIPPLHPLYSRADLTLADLVSQPFAAISPLKTLAASAELSALFKDYGFSRSLCVYKQTIDDIDLAMRVENLMGFLPGELAREGSRLVKVPDAVAAPMEYGWYYHELTPEVRWVVDNLT